MPAWLGSTQGHSLAEVLPVLRTQVAATTGIAPNSIKFCLKGDVTPNFTGDVDVLFVIGGFRGDPGNRDRHDCRIYRYMDVVLRYRYETDETGVSESWLLGPLGSNGAIAVEESILNALQNYWPPGTPTNLTFEPIGLAASPGYRRPMKGQPGCGEVTLPFEIPLDLPMTQTGT